MEHGPSSDVPAAEALLLLMAVSAALTVLGPLDRQQFLDELELATEDLLENLTVDSELRALVWELSDSVEPAALLS